MMQSLKLELEQLIQMQIASYGVEGVVPTLAACRLPEHGDLTSNVAFLLARHLKRAPQNIADALASVLTHSSVAAFEAVAGYVNIRIKPEVKAAYLKRVCQEGVACLVRPVSNAPRYLLEFVSANPTGPLHVGHGRQAAVADALVSMMRLCGYEVDTEYYVNDAGLQMDILVASVWMRVGCVSGVVDVYPKGLYQGAYLIPIAERIMNTYALRFDEIAWQQYVATLTPELLVGMREGYSDEASEIEVVKSLVCFVKTQLRAVYEEILRDVLSSMMEGITGELAALGVVMGRYYSERSLVDQGCVDVVLAQLQSAGHTYERDGALWFAATRFGDDKDRVLVRSNGERTYFTNDIAYHWDKVQRGYGFLVNFLGSDHHGYVARLTAALEALGSRVPLRVRLVQFVSLVRAGVRVGMSTRKATFETLSDVIEECGRDATRFFYIEKHIDQPLDFDLELAVAQHQENPVYYVQYAYARMSRVLERSGAIDMGLEAVLGEEESELWEVLMRFDETLHRCVDHLDPCFLATYLIEIARKFHSYYAHVPILSSEGSLRQGRLMLLYAVRAVLAAGLDSLGVAHPESM